MYSWFRCFTEAISVCWDEINETRIFIALFVSAFINYLFRTSIGKFVNVWLVNHNYCAVIEWFFFSLFRNFCSLNRSVMLYSELWWWRSCNHEKKMLLGVSSIDNGIYMWRNSFPANCYDAVFVGVVLQRSERGVLCTWVVAMACGFEGTKNSLTILNSFYIVWFLFLFSIPISLCWWVLQRTLLRLSFCCINGEAFIS